MSADELVVSDTSPVLNLALIDRLDLIEAQFSSVHVPEQVPTELTAGDDGFSRLDACRERDGIHVASVEPDELVTELTTELDLGEAAAISYAIEMEADLILLDEREGRTAARRHGRRVTGAIGILMKAARQGAVDIEREMERLRRAGFWIADDLYDDVIDRTRSD